MRESSSARNPVPTNEKTMKRLSPKLQNNRRVYIFSVQVALVCALLLLSITANAQDVAWPQFRGPESNPVGTHARLAERWSKTENVEWSQEIPGRGWSSPIVTGGKVYVTTVTTEGKSKQPQIGTEYSNEYVAELQKQGLSMQEIIKRLNERDIELPNEVKLHYILYRLDLKTRQGRMDEGVFHRTSAGRASSQKQFRLRNSGHRRKIHLPLRSEPRFVGLRFERQRGLEHAARSRIRFISISEPAARPHWPETCWLSSR